MISVLILPFDFDWWSALIVAGVVTVTFFEFRVHHYFLTGDPRAPDLGFRNQSCFAAAILQTNFISTVSLLTWLGNYFQEQHAGTLAVVSSVAGDRGRKSNYVYGASKGALNVFLDGLRNRIDRDGVQVLTIKPGFVATPMTAHVPQNALFASPDQVARGILKAIERGRDVAYVPGFWMFVMLLIRAIPGRIFKKMNL